MNIELSEVVPMNLCLDLDYWGCVAFLLFVSPRFFTGAKLRKGVAIILLF